MLSNLIWWGIWSEDCLDNLWNQFCGLFLDVWLEEHMADLWIISILLQQSLGLKIMVYLEHNLVWFDELAQDAQFSFFPALQGQLEVTLSQPARSANGTPRWVHLIYCSIVSTQIRIKCHSSRLIVCLIPKHESFCHVISFHIEIERCRISHFQPRENILLPF